MENQQTWNRQQMEEQIKSALTDLTPDIWNKLDLSAPQELGESGRRKKTAGGKGISFVGRARTMAAAACLCLVLGGGFSYYEFGQIVTVVGLDVNPSVELCLNRQDRVVKSIAINEDGEAVIYQKNIKGRKLEEAVDSVITTMTEQGYLKKNESERSAVLVTVSSKKKEDGKQELCRNLSSNVEHSLAVNEVQAVVYEQPAVVEEEARQEILQLAEEYRISQGKASFIQALVEENENVQAEDVPSLAAMTMGELSAQIDQESYQLKSEVQVTSVTEETIRRVREEEPEGRAFMPAQEETAALEAGSRPDKTDSSKVETETAGTDRPEAENSSAGNIDEKNVGDIDTDSEEILESVDDNSNNKEKTEGSVGEKNGETEERTQAQETEQPGQTADTEKPEAGAEETAGTGGQALEEESRPSDESGEAGTNQPSEETESGQDGENRPVEETETDPAGTSGSLEGAETDPAITDTPSDGAETEPAETSQASDSTSQEEGDTAEDSDKSDENQNGMTQDTPLEEAVPDGSGLSGERAEEEIPEDLPSDETCIENLPGENDLEASSKKNPDTVRTDSVPYETGEKATVIKRDEIHQILEQIENEAEWCWKDESGAHVMPGPGTTDLQEDTGQKDERQKIAPGPGMEESIWEKEFLDQEDQVARWLHGPGISPSGDRLIGYSIRNSTTHFSGDGAFSGLFNNRGIIRRDSRSKIRMNAWYRSLVQNFEEIR